MFSEGVKEHSKTRLGVFGIFWLGGERGGVETPNPIPPIPRTLNPKPQGLACPAHSAMQELRSVHLDSELQLFFSYFYYNIPPKP